MLIYGFFATFTLFYSCALAQGNWLRSEVQTLGKGSKKRKETGVALLADWREDGAVPTEGVWNIVSAPGPLAAASAAAVLLILFYQT